MLTRRNASRWQVSSPLLLLAGLSHCAPTYELLASTEAGSGGAEAVGGSVSAGNPRTAGSGGLSSGGLSSGGASSGGASSGGVSAALGSACASHVDCVADSICRDYVCVACPEPSSDCAPSCADGFRSISIMRNGCTICECVPPSECASDADCGNGEVCYAGAQCEDGCSEPACCYGNQCSSAGCPIAPAPHCLAAGCAAGARCVAACDAVSCECDAGQWACAGNASNGGAPGACAQTCVSP